MAKRNDVALALVIGVLMLGAVYVGSNYLSTKSIGVTTPGQTPTTTPAIVTSCGSSSTAPTLSLTAFYNKTTTVPATPTQIAESYSVYQPGSPLAFASGTTSASAATSVSGINCGSEYTVFFGGNSNYFLTAFSVKSQNNTQGVVKQLQPISAPTAKFNNGTIAGYVGQAKFFAVPNGYTDTNLQMRISAGSGFWGNPDSVVMFAYNTTQIKSISLNLPTASVPSSVVSIPAGYATVAYQISQMSDYQQNTYNPVFMTGTLPSNTLNASAINVYLISQASYNNNGNLETGLFANPTSQAALVTPVSSVATSSGTGGILVYG